MRIDSGILFILYRSIRCTHRWVVGCVAFALALTSVNAPAMAQTWQDHERREKEKVRIAENIGMDPQWITDPKGWQRGQEREAKRSAERRERERRATQEARVADAPLTEHARRKAAVRDRYEAYLLSTADEQLRRIASEPPAAPASPRARLANPAAERARRRKRRPRRSCPSCARSLRRPCAWDRFISSLGPSRGSRA